MKSKRSARSGSNISDAPSSNLRGGSRETPSKFNRGASVSDAPSRPQMSREQISKGPKAGKEQISRDAPSKDEKKRKKDEDEKKKKEEEKLKKEAEKKKKEEDKKKKEEEKKREEVRKKAKGERKKDAQKTMVNANKKLVRSTDADVAVLVRAKKVETSGLKTNTKKTNKKNKKGSKETTTKGSAEVVSMIHDREQRSGESLISARDLTHGEKDMLATNFSALQEALAETKKQHLELAKKEQGDLKLQKRQQKLMGMQVEAYRKMILGRKMVEAELFARSNEVALVYIVALEKEAIRLNEFPIPRSIPDWTKLLASRLIPLMLTFVLAIVMVGLLFTTASMTMPSSIFDGVEKIPPPVHYKNYFFEVHRLMKPGESFTTGKEFYTSCPLYDMGEWNFLKNGKNRKTNKTTNIYKRKVIVKVENRMHVPGSLVMKCPPSLFVKDQS